jgi:heterodisulfide reductase subunit C2
MSSPIRDTAENGLTHADPLHSIREQINACMQCGTCTGSCANSNAMDYTPRQLWRMVQLELTDEIFNSKTFWLCSTCYYCTLRCPRGLKLTEAMSALKRLAVAEGKLKDKKSIRFYTTFLDNVRRYGRVREMDMMTRYFLALKSPLTPIGFTPLGVKLMAKGKISVQMPNLFGAGKMDAIYRKVRELEAK